MVNSLCHSFYSSADVLSNNQQIQTIINVINEVMSFKFDFSNFADDNAPLSLQQNFKDLQIRETSIPYLIGICCVGYCVEDVRKPREAKRKNLSAKNKTSDAIWDQDKDPDHINWRPASALTTASLLVSLLIFNKFLS